MRQKHGSVPRPGRWRGYCSFPATGASWTIRSPAPLSAALRRRVAELVASFERTWSRFRPDSLVSRAARGEFGAGPALLDLPPGSGRILDLYDRLHAASSGRIDPLVGARLVELGYDPAYSFTVRHGDLHRLDAPAETMNWAASAHHDGDLLRLETPALVDVGAVGKGALADLVSDLLDGGGVTEHIVDASGDVVVRSAEPVRIGLEEPGAENRVVGVVELTEGAVCASGISHRAWGNGLHHILDALTGEPTSSVLASWTVARRGAEADGLATALFMTPPQDLAAAGFRFDFVLLRSDGTAAMSRTFPRLGEVFTREAPHPAARPPAGPGKRAL